MLFKNNPGKEENTHSGSEKKFPWWYFLQTHRGFGLANEEPLTRQDNSYRLHKDISVSFSLSLRLIFPHFQSLPLLLPLPLLTSPAPCLFHPSSHLSFNVSRSLSQLFLCAHKQSRAEYRLMHFLRSFMWLHSTNVLLWTHSHWPGLNIFGKLYYLLHLYDCWRVAQISRMSDTYILNMK